MRFKLDQCRIVDGMTADYHKRSIYITFVQGEYADVKTITDKRLKSLKSHDPKLLNLAAMNAAAQM